MCFSSCVLLSSLHPSPLLVLPFPPLRPILPSLLLSPLSPSSLLIQWFLLGANISNFAIGGIWGILFHLGLAGETIASGVLFLDLY